MHCTNCGAAVAPSVRFCPNCGTDQIAATVSAAAAPQPVVFDPAAFQPAGVPAKSSVSGARVALWSLAACVVAGALGAAGYWGWTGHVAAEQAARKVSELEKAAALLQQQQAQAASAAEAASAKAVEEDERASVAAAQLALDKHIAEEEAQARNLRR